MIYYFLLSLATNTFFINIDLFRYFGGGIILMIHCDGFFLRIMAKPLSNVLIPSLPKSTSSFGEYINYLGAKHSDKIHLDDSHGSHAFPSKYKLVFTISSSKYSICIMSNKVIF